MLAGHVNVANLTGLLGDCGQFSPMSSQILSARVASQLHGRNGISCSGENVCLTAGDPWAWNIPRTCRRLNQPNPEQDKV
mgnify:CR=1 FL=1